MRWIRVVLFFVAITGITACRSTVIYNTAVKAEYANFLKLVPNELRAGGIVNQNYTITRLADLRSDTLNKGDTIPSKVNIVEVMMPNQANKRGKGERSYDTNAYIPLMYCSSSTHGDTLVVKMQDVFRNMQITHTIIKGKVTTLYEEFVTDKPIYIASPQGKPADSITVQAKRTRFELNSPNFDSEAKLYGKVEFETAPFYVKNTMYKNGYVKKRVLAKYVFVVSR